MPEEQRGDASVDCEGCRAAVSGDEVLRPHGKECRECIGVTRMCDDAGVREPEVSAGTCLGSDSQPLYLPCSPGAGRFEHMSHHLLFYPRELLQQRAPMEQRTRGGTLFFRLDVLFAELVADSLESHRHCL